MLFKNSQRPLVLYPSDHKASVPVQGSACSDFYGKIWQEVGGNPGNPILWGRRERYRWGWRGHCAHTHIPPSFITLFSLFFVAPWLSPINLPFAAQQLALISPQYKLKGLLPPMPPTQTDLSAFTLCPSGIFSTQQCSSIHSSSREWKPKSLPWLTASCMILPSLLLWLLSYWAWPSSHGSCHTGFLAAPSTCQPVLYQGLSTCYALVPLPSPWLFSPNWALTWPPLSVPSALHLTVFIPHST